MTRANDAAIKAKTSVVIRGLPPEVIEAIATEAGQSNRSVEAEFRNAILQYAEPLLLKQGFAAARTELAQRLQSAHRTFLDQHPDHSPARSYLAQAIGEDRAGPLESWFDGTRAAPFGKLQLLARYLGCSASWLIHGDEQPVPERSSVSAQSESRP